LSLWTCLEAACEEDTTKKLVYKAGVADEVFPEEIVNVFNKLQQQEDVSINCQQTEHTGSQTVEGVWK